MDRVAAARERLSDLKRELSASDLFCVDCQYLRGPNCHHPAVQSHSIDSVTGVVSSHPAPAKAARSDTGACGPEAALFEPQPTVVVKAAWNGVQNAVAVVIGAIVVASLAVGLLL